MKDIKIFILGNTTCTEERACLTRLQDWLREGYDIINTASAGNTIVYVLERKPSPATKPARTAKK